MQSVGQSVIVFELFWFSLRYVRVGLVVQFSQIVDNGVSVVFLHYFQSKSSVVWHWSPSTDRKGCTLRAEEYWRIPTRHPEVPEKEIEGRKDPPGQIGERRDRRLGNPAGACPSQTGRPTAEVKWRDKIVPGNNVSVPVNIRVIRRMPMEDENDTIAYQVLDVVDLSAVSEEISRKCRPRLESNKCW